MRSSCRSSGEWNSCWMAWGLGPKEGVALCSQEEVCRDCCPGPRGLWYPPSLQEDGRPGTFLFQVPWPGVCPSTEPPSPLRRERARPTTHTWYSSSWPYLVFKDIFRPCSQPMEFSSLPPRFASPVPAKTVCLPDQCPVAVPGPGQGGTLDRLECWGPHSRKKYLWTWSQARPPLIYLGNLQLPAQIQVPNCLGLVFLDGVGPKASMFCLVFVCPDSYLAQSGGVRVWPSLASSLAQSSLLCGCLDSSTSILPVSWNFLSHRGGQK